MSKRKHESRCTRNPKHKPYGTKGTNPYCNAHDCHMNYSVSKSAERQRARREIVEITSNLEEEDLKEPFFTDEVTGITYIIIGG